MGGDFGAPVNVEGALALANDPTLDIVLVGKQAKIRTLMRDMGMPERRPRVVNAEEMVGMSESPKASLRKKDSSLAVCVDLLKKGEVDAVVSMGNTGACMANAVLKWRILPGVSRPALAQVMPVPDHPVLLLDVGANVDCRPQHLVDFAIMGSVYAEHVFNRPNPRVGVMSVGEEDGKGNELSLSVFKELKGTDKLNFVGNAEGRDVFSKRFDVIVCDGFVGNVVLKFGESLAKMIMTGLKGEITKNPLSALAALAINPQLQSFKKQVAADEFGGAPLLGVNGIFLVGHGSSEPKAITSALKMAAKIVEGNINEKIVKKVAEYRPKVQSVEV